MPWTKETPKKNGKYWFRPLDEEPRLVTVDAKEDKIFDTFPQQCMRSLITFSREEFNTLWADGNEEQPPLPDSE